jgi:hypothetical protein
VHDISLPGQFAGQPQVAARPDGGAVVVWERHNTSRDVTRIQSTVVHPDGIVAACCFDLTDATTNRNGFEPQVAVAPDNTAFVVWDRHNGSEQIVQARKLAVSGSPTATTYDLSTSGQNAIEPDLAVTFDGKATVAWTRFDGTNWVVQARRLAAAGEPEGAAVDISEPGGPALQPQVVALPSSSASIVWKQLDGSTYAVKERRLGQDGFAGTTSVLSAAGVDAHEPQVAVGPDGSETVVWALSNGTGEVVQARRIDADGVPAAETVDLSDGGADAGAPFVAAGGSSSVAVAWRRFDGVRDHVQIAALRGVAVAPQPGTGTQTPPGGTTTAPVPGKGLPDNEFRLGRVKLDRRHGTARLEVWVPGPGSLQLGGSGIASPSRTQLRERAVSRSGAVFLAIAATGKKQKMLLRRGRVKVRVQVAYLPIGGSRRIKTRALQLHFDAQSRLRRGR